MLKLMPKSWQTGPETILENSFRKKHQKDAKMTKNDAKTGGVEVVNWRFFRARARPGPPRAPLPHFHRSEAPIYSTESSLFAESAHSVE